MTEDDSDSGRQAHTTFADSPTRFRNAPTGQGFSGSSGLLFEQAMAQTRMAVALADPYSDDLPLVFVNNAFVKLTGYSEDEVIGRNCRFLQGPDTDPETVAKLRHAIETEDVLVVEILNYRKDGSSFWNALHLGPIYDEQGKLIYYFASQWDVSDVHAARADEKHAKMMSRELSHRMKNVFAVIGGLVTVTGRTRDIKDEANEINERIRALGRAFETTLDDASRGSVELLPAVKAVLDPYDGSGERIFLKGRTHRVDPNVISTVGLTLHELATNAIKYGALGTEQGEVELSWEIDDTGGLVLFWSERGGPEVTPPEKGTGTGIGIIEALLDAVDGALVPEWEPDGMKARIEIPRVTRKT